MRIVKRLPNKCTLMKDGKGRCHAQGFCFLMFLIMLIGVSPNYKITISSLQKM